MKFRLAIRRTAVHRWNGNFDLLHLIHPIPWHLRILYGLVCSLEIGQTKCKRLKLPSIWRTTVSQKAVRMVSVLFFKFLDLSLTKPLWQLCAVMMSWVQWWVKLFVYWHIQRFLSYLQKIAKSFSKFLLFHSLNFHVSGSPESVSKQTTELIIELNSSRST